VKFKEEEEEKADYLNLLILGPQDFAQSSLKKVGNVKNK
jgi:hypothetical protein